MDMEAGVKNTVTTEMAIVIDSTGRPRLKLGSDRVTLRINLSRALLFSVKRAAKSRGIFTSSFIKNILLKYDPHEHGVNPIEKCFIKYFIHRWPYQLKDKVKGATRMRTFHLVTERNFIDNVKRLALLEALSTNDFVVKVLSEAMVQELQDPLVYRKKIPDY